MFFDSLKDWSIFLLAHGFLVGLFLIGFGRISWAALAWAWSTITGEPEKMYNPKWAEIFMMIRGFRHEPGYSIWLCPHKPLLLQSQATSGAKWEGIRYYAKPKAVYVGTMDLIGVTASVSGALLYFWPFTIFAVIFYCTVQYLRVAYNRAKESANG